MYRPDILGTQVPVRYDPFNVGIAYAYLDKTWVRCTSEHYATFHNRTEQELQIAREEMVASYRARGRDIRTLNARLLADFLERTTTSERLLRQQQCDDAMQSIRSSVTQSASVAVSTAETEICSSADGINGEAVLKPSFTHLLLPDDF